MHTCVSIARELERKGWQRNRTYLERRNIVVKHLKFWLRDCELVETVVAHTRLSTRTLYRSKCLSQSKTARQSKAQSAMISLRLACIIASTMRPGAHLNKQHAAICVGGVPDGRLHSLPWKSVTLSRTLAELMFHFPRGRDGFASRRREVVTKE